MLLEAAVEEGVVNGPPVLQENHSQMLPSFLYVAPFPYPSVSLVEVRADQAAYAYP